MIGIYSTCNYYITGGAAPQLQLQQWTLRAFKISRPILNCVCMAWACIVDKILHNAAGRTDRDALSPKGPGGPPSRGYINMGKSSIALPNLALQQYNS